jgi:hypothetical protein
MQPMSAIRHRTVSVSGLEAFIREEEADAVAEACSPVLLDIFGG